MFVYSTFVHARGRLISPGAQVVLLGAIVLGPDVLLR